MFISKLSSLLRYENSYKAVKFNCMMFSPPLCLLVISAIKHLAFVFLNIKVCTIVCSSKVFAAIVLGPQENSLFTC